MGEIGVVIIVALIVLLVILFFIAVEQGNALAKYERQLMDLNKAQVKVRRVRNATK